MTRENMTGPWVVYSLDLSHRQVCEGSVAGSSLLLCCWVHENCSTVAAKAPVDGSRLQQLHSMSVVLDILLTFCWLSCYLLFLRWRGTRGLSGIFLIPALAWELLVTSIVYTWQQFLVSASSPANHSPAPRRQTWNPPEAEELEWSTKKN